MVDYKEKDTLIAFFLKLNYIVSYEQSSLFIYRTDNHTCTIFLKKKNH